jgi:hypothetical protein
MAVRTQTAQEISRTRAGARSRRLRDNVALLPRPDERLVLASPNDRRSEPCSALRIDPSEERHAGWRVPRPA